jgi:hypothetical protein
MQLAEEPRVGAMDEPGKRENELDVLPNGRKKTDMAADDGEAIEEQSGGESEEAKKDEDEGSGAESAEDTTNSPTDEKRSSESETTAVATPEPDDKHDVSSSAALAKAPLKHVGYGADKSILERNMATA